MKFFIGMSWLVLAATLLGACGGDDDDGSSSGDICTRVENKAKQCAASAGTQLTDQCRQNPDVTVTCGLNCFVNATCADLKNQSDPNNPFAKCFRNCVVGDAG